MYVLKQFKRKTPEKLSFITAASAVKIVPSPVQSKSYFNITQVFGTAYDRKRSEHIL